MKFNGIILEPSTVCNLRCRGCTHTSPTFTRRHELMDIDLAKKCIEQIVTAGFTKVFMFGMGEPLLSDNIINMIKMAKENGLAVIISTNGNYHISNRDLYDSGIDKIIFSFDGMSQEVYEQYRVGGKVQILKRNIVELSVLNKRGMTIEAQFIAFEWNITQLELVEDFVAKLPTVTFNVKNTLYKPAPAHNAAKNRPTKEDPFAYCLQPMILVDGRVALCCRDFNGDYTIGDLSKGENLVDILSKHPRKYDPANPLCVKQCPHLKNVKSSIRRSYLFILKHYISRFFRLN